MKRFYKNAEAGTAPGGYVIRLDGKMLKTPLQHPLILASKELAEAIAAEWNAQSGEINPASMLQMQLASTMIDKCTSHERPAMNAEMEKYAGSDLLCYFGDHPADLVERQEAVWRPLLAWLEREKGIRLETVSGIRYQNQPAASVRKIGAMAAKMNPQDFVVLQTVTAMTGSVVIALALAEGHIDADEAYEAACVDEIYQLEKWGEDGLARKKLDKIAEELKAIAFFRDHIKASA